MGQKDLTQKQLEDYEDVFADIVNALLYEGKRVLLPEMLQSAPTETLYYSKGKYLRNQFHDVSKYDMSNGRINVQYTLENENRSSSKMLLRKAGYEGAVYRAQYEKKVKEIYPIISLVLHWGTRRWRTSKSLRNFFDRKGIPKNTVRCIDNFRLQVYDMCFLSRSVRERFKSDMRMVVDYLAEGEHYKPTKQPIQHVEAFLLMMKAISKDVRYEQLIPEFKNQEKEEITMCSLLDRYETIGIEKGEDFFAKLMECLFRDKRMVEAKLVLTDVDTRKRLYKEYGIC